MASSEPSIVIRHATREDIPTILLLVRELAEYEHALDSVHATAEHLSKTLSFAPSPSSSTTTTSTPDLDPLTPTAPARCLLLFTPAGAPAGLALYFYNYSTWRGAPGIYLEDLYVRPAERRKGYAGRLLAQLAREVVRVGGGRLEWSVLKWNEPSIRFYESGAVGATRLEEWVGMRVDGEKLKALAEKAEGVGGR